MAKNPETVFKEQVANDLKWFEQQGKLWKSRIQQEAIRGTPDYILCVKGYFVAIELKRGGNVPAEPLQLYNKRRVKNSGGVYFIAHPENWVNIFQYIVNLANKKEGAGVQPSFEE